MKNVENCGKRRENLGKAGNFLLGFLEKKGGEKMEKKERNLPR